MQFFSLMPGEGTVQELTTYSVMLGSLIFSLLFKLSVFPNYFWVRSLYCSVSTPIVCLFGLPVKIALFVVFFRLFGVAFVGLSFLWGNLVLFSGLGSIIFGCFITLQSKGIHAFIAGSGINHMGFILCGIACNTSLGFTSSIVYLLNYLITSLAFFVLLSKLKKMLNRPVVYLKDLFTIQSDPVIQGPLVVILFSFAGIPPFAGFFGKFLILSELYNKGYILLCIIIILSALISAYYYLRIICFASFKKSFIAYNSLLDDYLLLVKGEVSSCFYELYKSEERVASIRSLLFKFRKKCAK
jgi:NADH-quinone oxidoreductase subunit N